MARIAWAVAAVHHTATTLLRDPEEGYLARQKSGELSASTTLPSAIARVKSEDRECSMTGVTATGSCLPPPTRSQNLARREFPIPFECRLESVAGSPQLTLGRVERAPRPATHVYSITVVFTRI